MSSSKLFSALAAVTSTEEPPGRIQLVPAGLSFSRDATICTGIAPGRFSKNGGFSEGIYRSLNCGRGSKDNKKNIKKNLSLVAKKMKINQKRLLLMHQTHSNKVIIINEKNKNTNKFKCDAFLTKLKGFALGVVTGCEEYYPVVCVDGVEDYKNCAAKVRLSFVCCLGIHL